MGPSFSRWRTAAAVVPWVLTRLRHGCPIQALVAAFGLAARTGATGVPRAGQHGQQVHQHRGQPGQVDRQHMQADERWVTRVVLAEG